MWYTETLWLEQFDKNKDEKISYEEVSDIINSGQVNIFKNTLNNLEADTPEEQKELLDAYNEIANDFKEAVLELWSNWELNKWDVWLTYLLQIIWKVEWTYKQEDFDWSWCKKTDNILLQLQKDDTRFQNLIVKWEWKMWEEWKTCNTETNFSKKEENIDVKNIKEVKEVNEIKENIDITVDNDKTIINDTNETLNDNIDKKLDIESTKTNNIHENINYIIQSSKDFNEYSEFIDTKKINNQSSPVLSNDIYSAYLRYKENPESLAKLLKNTTSALTIKEEDKKSFDEKDSSSLNPYFKVDKSVKFIRVESLELIEEQYPEKIIENFVNLIENTDAWQKLLENTTIWFYETKLRENINKNLAYNKESSNEVTTWIETKTKELLWDIFNLETELKEKLKTFDKEQELLKQNDYLNWEKIRYQDIPNEYREKIDTLISNYAKQVWVDLIKNNTNLVKEEKIFNLPIWNWEDVILDFSEIWDIEGKNIEEKIKLFEESFDDIYIDKLWERIYDSLISKKWLIDISGIIISWFTAMSASTASLVITKNPVASILVASTTFTATENAYRAVMYEAFVDWGWKEGLWIEENDTHRDILQKKWFELASNTVLFSLFKISWFTQDVIMEKYFKDKVFTHSLSSDIKNFWLKTWAEAGFLHITLFYLQTYKKR